MGKTTIQWTDFTFNPWWGCTRVSPGCERCYAESFAARVGVKWGVHAERRFFGDKHWAEPIKWNAQAEKRGERHRVFCASMADVFEDRPELTAERAKLFVLIHATPHLDWLLLTKRPENMERLADARWMHGWPSNVWAGCTVEDQRRANERIPHLLRVPAAVRFLSCEPLLEHVDLTNIRYGNGDFLNALRRDRYRGGLDSACVDWIIVGGESGRGAREFNFAWARSIVAQCKAAGVAVFVKQLGENPHGEWGPNPPMVHVIDVTVRPTQERTEESRHKNGRWRLTAKKGGAIDEFPAELKVREFPEVRR